MQHSCLKAVVKDLDHPHDLRWDSMAPQHCPEHLPVDRIEGFLDLHKYHIHFSVPLKGLLYKRAMSIIYPSHSYTDALSFAGIQTLCARREEACSKFVANIKANNPLYPFIHKQLPTLNHDYSLRSATTETQPIIRTDRFESFITVKYGKTEPCNS